MEFGFNQPLSVMPLAGQEMSTCQGAVAVLCGREGNRRSGVALVIHNRLCGMSTYGLNGLRKGELLDCTSIGTMPPFTFYT